MLNKSWVIIRCGRQWRLWQVFPHPHPHPIPPKNFTIKLTPSPKMTRAYICMNISEYLLPPPHLCVNRCTCLAVVSLEQGNKRVHILCKLWWSDDNQLSTLEIQHVELFYIQWHPFDRCLRPNNNYGHMETGPWQSLIWQTGEAGDTTCVPQFIGYTSAAPRRMSGCLSRPWENINEIVSLSKLGVGV